MELDRQLIEKLGSIPWFCKCGSPPPFEWAASATSTKAVLKAITSRKWENMILETQGGRYRTAKSAFYQRAWP